MGVRRPALQMVSLFMFLLVWIPRAKAQVKIFNVMSYGATGDGNTDNTLAFFFAWEDACDCEEERVRVFVPNGTYKLGPIKFVGPCKSSSIAFIIKGVLRAHTGVGSLNIDHWITFQYIDGLTISGGGVLDGQGASAWPYNNCHLNKGCMALPATMRFDFVTHSNIHHITSLNSKQTHFNIYGCSHLNMSDIRISAPGDSPNTDGIHIGNSARIRMTRMTIATGDDCISFSPGSRKISISKIFCGPGHGISVGSLGQYQDGETVKKLTVKNCTFSGTTNGLRIKTWAESVPGFASDFTFEDIIMNDVYNPIIIDQEYCPYPPCNRQVASNVQISNVIFRNIYGTSMSRIAVNLKCSQTVPCRNILLENINLAYNGVDGESAISSCLYVNGDSYGSQNPPSCM